MTKNLSGNRLFRPSFFPLMSISSGNILKNTKSDHQRHTWDTKKNLFPFFIILLKSPSFKWLCSWIVWKKHKKKTYLKSRRSKTDKNKRGKRVRHRGRYIIHWRCHNVESCTYTWQGEVSDCAEVGRGKKKTLDCLLTVTGSLWLSGPIIQGETNSILLLQLGLMDWQTLLEAHDGAPARGNCR